eukprot:GGOE01065081.1.p2 GENE.GGOE01065081.1~~GGOE01065081.1.p2  ORF type:complete len:154 (-),score=68.54 GGOE01065081.1:290-718(-)
MATKYFPCTAYRLKAMAAEKELRVRREARDRRYDFEFFPEFNGTYLHTELRRITLHEQAQKLQRLRDSLHEAVQQQEEFNARPEAQAEVEALRQKLGSPSPDPIKSVTWDMDWDPLVLLARGPEQIPEADQQAMEQSGWRRE